MLPPQPDLGRGVVYLPGAEGGDLEANLGGLVVFIWSLGIDPGLIETYRILRKLHPEATYQLKMADEPRGIRLGFHVLAEQQAPTRDAQENDVELARMCNWGDDGLLVRFETDRTVVRFHLSWERIDSYLSIRSRTTPIHEPDFPVMVPAVEQRTPTAPETCVLAPCVLEVDRPPPSTRKVLMHWYAMVEPVAGAAATK